MATACLDKSRDEPTALKTLLLATVMYVLFNTFKIKIPLNRTGILSFVHRTSLVQKFS